MKVLFVLDRFPPEIGGSERLFQNLREALLQEGVEVEVFTCRHPNRVKEKGVLEFPSRSRVLFAVFGNFWLLFKMGRYDLLHSTSFFSGIACFLPCFFGKKAILTYHELWLNRWKHLPYLSSFQKFALRSLESSLKMVSFSHLVAVSKFTLEELKSVYPKRNLSLIYNGLEIRDAEPESDQGDYYLMYSRLGVSKGLHLLKELNAADLPSNFKLKLVLPNYPKSFYRKIVPGLKRDFIEHLPEVSDAELKKLIMGSKAVLFPSVSEGFGFAALECCLLGKTVIHSGKGALDEVVSGSFVRMKEYSARGLNEAIHAFEAGEIERTELKQFPISEMVDKYRSLYREVLAQ